MFHNDILPIILSYLDVPSKVCALNTCKLFATIIGDIVVQYHDDLYNLAAKCGYLEVLKWLRSYDPSRPMNKYVCSDAASNGHLEVLKWARENGCDWDAWTCADAAGGGHLETLKWLRLQDGGEVCPWDKYTCSYAAKNGHLEVLKWARTQSPACDWDEETCSMAAKG